MPTHDMVIAGEYKRWLAALPTKKKEVWMDELDVRAKKRCRITLIILEHAFQSGTTYGRHSGAKAGRFERECSFDGGFANDGRGPICPSPAAVYAASRLGTTTVSIADAVNSVSNT